MIGSNPMLLLVNPAVPAQTMKEFIAAAKQKPGGFSYSTPGVASQAHLIIAQLIGTEGVDAVQIPYRGGAPAMLAAISGETQFTLMSSSLAGSQVEAGKLRALAIGGQHRDPRMPNVPTFAEAGFPGLSAVTWAAIFAPAGTPPDIVARLNAAIVKVINTPKFRQVAERDGEGDPVGNRPEEMAAIVKKDLERYATLMKAGGIKPE